MQHLESSKEIASLSGIHSQERFGRLPMENSECFSHTKSAEYKRHRVSAVRDFPLGCGRFAQLSSLNANGLEKISDKKYPPRSVEAIRDFPLFCGINASLDARNFGQEKSIRGYKSSSSNTAKTVVKQTGLGDKVQPDTKKKIRREKQGYSHHDEKEQGHVIPESWSTDGCPPPFDNDTSVRNKVKETLRLFKDECEKRLLEEERKRAKGERTSHRRVDLEAFTILKDRGIFAKSGKQIIGAIPGVEVGDKFHYRVELILIGLHHQIQGGIAYGNFGGKVLATSVVASGGYADDLHNKDTLIYTGQGGNVMNRKDPQDQKLERGNLALKNSVQTNPVRVIRGSESLDGSRTYFYDGLYLVEKYWQERGASW